MLWEREIAGPVHVIRDVEFRPAQQSIVVEFAAYSRFTSRSKLCHAEFDIAGDMRSRLSDDTLEMCAPTSLDSESSDGWSVVGGAEGVGDSWRSRLVLRTSSASKCYTIDNFRLMRIGRDDHENLFWAAGWTREAGKPLTVILRIDLSGRILSSCWISIGWNGPGANEIKLVNKRAFLIGDGR